MADKDKKRHAAEMEHYQPPATENGGKKMKQKRQKKEKDPNAPKRPLSAFLWFSNDERPKAKATMVEPTTLGGVAKELGRRWGEISEHDKAKYIALAAKDKARYEKVPSFVLTNTFSFTNSLFSQNQEVEAYKQVKARPAAKVESSEDDEEEEEEEIDEEEDEDSDE